MRTDQSLSVIRCFGQSISLTFRNFFTFFGAAILAWTFSILTLGFMFPCLMTGLENMYLRAKAGDKVRATDVFAHGRKWWSLYWDSVALAWLAGWPLAAFYFAIDILSPAISETLDPRYAPIFMIAYLVVFILLGLWSIFRESKHLHALNLAAEFGLKGKDSRRLSELAIKNRWKDTIFALLLTIVCPLYFILGFVPVFLLLPFFMKGATPTPLLLYWLLVFTLLTLLLLLVMGATAMAFLHDLGEKEQILELTEKYLEEYKRPVGKPENPCPTCGNYNVRYAYIEDGGRGDWCPDCKMSLKSMRGLA